MAKFVMKYGMHKLGVEISLIYGMILACAYHDVCGVFYLSSVATLRIVPWLIQGLLWSVYSRILLGVIFLEYISAWVFRVRLKLALNFIY